MLPVTCNFLLVLFICCISNISWCTDFFLFLSQNDNIVVIIINYIRLLYPVLEGFITDLKLITPDWSRSAAILPYGRWYVSGQEMPSTLFSYFLNIYKLLTLHDLLLLLFSRTVLFTCFLKRRMQFLLKADLWRKRVTRWLRDVCMRMRRIYPTGLDRGFIV